MRGVCYPFASCPYQVAAVDKPQLHMWETGVMRITRYETIVQQLLQLTALHDHYSSNQIPGTQLVPTLSSNTRGVERFLPEAALRVLVYLVLVGSRIRAGLANKLCAAVRFDVSGMFQWPHAKSARLLNSTWDVVLSRASSGTHKRLGKRCGALHTWRGLGRLSRQ